MNNKINEEVFEELFIRAKAGDTSRLPSVDRAVVWAHGEIQRLRAIVASLNDTQNEPASAGNPIHVSGQ